MKTADVNELEHIGRVLGQWQHDGGPLHLHPGDLGWYSLRGVTATAAAIRVWSDNDVIAAIALLDGPGLLRFAMDPKRHQDETLARRIASTVSDPSGGVIEAGIVTIEARGTRALGAQLTKEGWAPDEPWTPLHRDLAEPVEDLGLHIETVEPRMTEEWVSVTGQPFGGRPSRMSSFIVSWLDGKQRLKGRSVNPPGSCRSAMTTKGR
ncbi:hypothetical protein [Arthrobacter flavus]|uniref:Uncharacterized protein n=1 Tax=Arthrobacter flavus TaxID=95172 RepID=A0ABW4Q876_9MICC